MTRRREPMGLKEWALVFSILAAALGTGFVWKLVAAGDRMIGDYVCAKKCACCEQGEP